MLRRAFGNTAGPIPMIVNDNVGLFNYLRGLVGGEPTRPPESPVTEPMAPAVSENPPSSFQLAQLEAARRAAAATASRPAAPPSAPTVTPAEASTPPAAQQPATTNSFLDMLRQRVKDQVAGEDSQRIRDIGIGMLASRSPNFFTMFGEGLQSANQAERQRLEGLRQAADAERQALAQRSEEEYRRQQTEIERERRASERDPTNPRNRLYAAQARFYEAGGPGSSAGATAATRAETQRDRAAREAGERAIREENTRRRNAFPQEDPLTEAEAARIRDIAARRYLAAPGQAAPETPQPAPGVPRITVNPSGQTTR
jgi:hypothetical protein